jgi:hypothetical protein
VRYAQISDLFLGLTIKKNKNFNGRADDHMEIDMKMMEHVLKLWLPGVFGST